MHNKTIPLIPRKRLYKIWFDNNVEFTTGIVIDKDKQSNMTDEKLIQMLLTKKLVISLTITAWLKQKRPQTVAVFKQQFYQG